MDEAKAGPSTAIDSEDEIEADAATKTETKDGFNAETASKAKNEDEDDDDTDDEDKAGAEAEAKAKELEIIVILPPPPIRYVQMEATCSSDESYVLVPESTSSVTLFEFNVDDYISPYHPDCVRPPVKSSKKKRDIPSCYEILFRSYFPILLAAVLLTIGCYGVLRYINSIRHNNN